MSETPEPGREHAGHRHGPDGAHVPENFGRAFAIGIALNTAFILVEVGYGIAANSMALLADAGHNLSDVLGLVVAWVAAMLSRRPPSERYTYGLRSSSILAALFNAVFLLLAVGAIAWEAILRLFNPEPVAGATVMAVAAIGIVINGITAWMFAGGRKSDLNIQGAYLHMAADAAVSAGVVAAAAMILMTGWLWIDPAVSLVVSAVIVWGTWGLLRQSLSMSLDAVPPGIAPDAVQAYLMQSNWRHRRARPPHLVDEHHRGRPDGSSGASSMRTGRRIPGQDRARPGAPVRHSSRHTASRKRRAAMRARSNSRRVARNGGKPKPAKPFTVVRSSCSTGPSGHHGRHTGKSCVRRSAAGRSLCRHRNWNHAGPARGCCSAANRRHSHWIGRIARIPVRFSVLCVRGRGRERHRGDGKSRSQGKAFFHGCLLEVWASSNRTTYVLKG